MRGCKQHLDRWQVLEAAAKSHLGTLIETIGPKAMEMVRDSLSVGPLDPYAPGKKRPVAVPTVGTMVKTA